MQINIPIEVTDRQMYDILSTALEGGIGYWSVAKVLERNGAPDYDYVKVDLFDAEDEDEKLGTLNVGTIRMGLDMAARRAGHSDSPDFDAAQLVVRQLLADDMDAEGADIVVQLGLFGEVVYG